MSVFFRKRRVRVHFNPQPNMELPDFEGVLVGVIDGHYLLRAAKILSSGESTMSLDNAVEIPRANVWWLERLT